MSKAIVSTAEQPARSALPLDSLLHGVVVPLVTDVLRRSPADGAPAHLDYTWPTAFRSKLTTAAEALRMG